MFDQLHKLTVQQDAVFKNLDAKQMMILRCAACLLLVLAFIYEIGPNSKRMNTMDDGECMRDQTFVWTTSINQWFLSEESKQFTRKYIIYASFLMDFTTLSGLIVFYLRCNTLRPIVAFIFFQLTRNLI